MPLFGSHRSTETTTTTPTTTTTSPPPARNRSIFNRRRSSSPAVTSSTTATHSPKRHSTLLSKHHEDGSITTARNSLMQAEAAEREADRALIVARNAVRDAREHVKRLEREAAEEARLAKIKQKQAQAIGKRGKALGRHDHV